MDWIDTLTGEHRDRPGMPIIPGQWRYDSDISIPLRGTHINRGNLLIPDSDGRFSSPKLGMLRADTRLLLDEDAAHTIRQMGRGIRTIEGFLWESWIHTSPLSLTIDEALVETQLEQDIRSGIDYLEAACQRPRTHLKTEEERLIVSRCKRPSPRASAILAARSEDWERRTLWGVRPKRVLSLINDEFYGIYENQVAVTLVDHLDLFLLRRIKAVRRVVELFRCRQDYQEVLENSANYRRAQRVLQLWGDAQEESGSLSGAKDLLNRLVSLRRRVLALKGSPLYRRIGHRKTAKIRLRMTNVLTHDSVYRHVAKLWTAWEEHVKTIEPDPETKWFNDQELAQSFQSFVFLVVIRSLGALGYRPAPESVESTLAETGLCHLDGPAGRLTLSRDQHHIFIKTIFNPEAMRIIPLPAILEGSGIIGRWLKQVPQDTNLLIVGLPADENRRIPIKDRLRLRSLGNRGERSGPMFAAAAPWDLESVERVACAIRWHVWSALYNAYPFCIPLQPGWVNPGDVPEWLGIWKQQAAIIEPGGDEAIHWPALQERISTMQQKAGGLRQKILTAKGTDRKHLKHELALEREGIDMDIQLSKNIKSSLEHAACLLNCPICDSSVSTWNFQAEDGLFYCHCSGCNSRWGLRRCGICGNAYPFLDFPGNDPSEGLLDADRRYGCDILALPLGKNRFLCPHCGNQETNGELTS